MSADDFDESMARLETLLQEVEERVPSESVDAVRALVQTLLDVHRLALSDALEALVQGSDPNLVRELASRPRVESLLLLHGLHPESAESRVAAALAVAHRSVPTDAHAEITRVEESRVVVRIRGGTPASASLLRRAVEKTVTERAPDVTLVVEGGTAPDPSLLPAERLLHKGRSAAE